MDYRSRSGTAYVRSGSLLALRRMDLRQMRPGEPASVAAPVDGTSGDNSQTPSTYFPPRRRSECGTTSSLLRISQLEPPSSLPRDAESPPWFLRIVTKPGADAHVLYAWGSGVPDYRIKFRRNIRAGGGSLADGSLVLRSHT